MLNYLYLYEMFDYYELKKKKTNINEKVLSVKKLKNLIKDSL